MVRVISPVVYASCKAFCFFVLYSEAQTCLKYSWNIVLLDVSTSTQRLFAIFFVREADKLVFCRFLANHSSPLGARQCHATVRCKSHTSHKLMHWIQLLRQYPTDSREIAQVIDLAFVWLPLVTV